MEQMGKAWMKRNIIPKFFEYSYEILGWFTGEFYSEYPCDKKLRDLQNFGIIFVIPNSE